MPAIGEWPSIHSNALRSCITVIVTAAACKLQQLTRYHTHTRKTYPDEELIADDLRRSVTADHNAFQVFGFSLRFHAFI